MTAVIGPAGRGPAPLRLDDGRISAVCEQHHDNLQIPSIGGLMEGRAGGPPSMSHQDVATSAMAEERPNRFALATNAGECQGLFEKARTSISGKQCLDRVDST